MSKNSFDLIMDWPYHPQLIIAIAFAVCYTAAMQSGGPIWAGLIVAAFTAPFAALLLFLPYLITVVSFAALFSLLLAILQAPRPYKQS